MGAMSLTHWLIVVGVLVLLFGAKKLPEMARSVGQSARVFKGEMKGLRDDDTQAEQTKTSGSAPAVSAEPPPSRSTPRSGTRPPS